MVNYRRNYVAGGCYFFTVTLRSRKATTLTDNMHLLRQAFREELNKRPFVINGIVVLPEHLHTVWTLPENDADYSGRWQAIKGSFTKALSKEGKAGTKNKRGEYDVWQKRFWEHTLRNETDYLRHLDYIHYNPVKHGLVQYVADWPYSSFHQFVRDGILPKDWAGSKALHDLQVLE